MKSLLAEIRGTTPRPSHSRSRRGRGASPVVEMMEERRSLSSAGLGTVTLGFGQITSIKDTTPPDYGAYGRRVFLITPSVLGPVGGNMVGSQNTALKILTCPEDDSLQQGKSDLSYPVVSSALGYLTVPPPVTSTPYKP